MAVVCYNLQDRLIPSLRQATARALSAQGLRQERIAEHLGVSQAMVSKYLRSPQRPTAVFSQADVDQLVRAAVERVLEQENQGNMAPWCPVCQVVPDTGDSTRAQAIINQCLRHETPVPRAAQKLVLQSLKDAQTWIERADLRPLQPAVRMNLAMCVPAPRDAREVAAFPGRLVELDGHVRAVSDPAFGSSTHLANVLLAIHAARPEIRAILNVRWDDRTRAAAGNAGLRCHQLRRSGAELSFKIGTKKPLDGVADPGGFGIEPNLYLIGKQPKHVMENALRLLTNLRKTEMNKNARRNS